MTRPTTTALTATRTSTTYGESTTFTADVAVEVGTATGTVSFAANGVELASATLTGGSASVTSNSIGAGTPSVIATYVPDIAQLTSSFSDPLPLTIAKAATTTTLTQSGPFSFTVAVSGVTDLTPSGTASLIIGEAPALDRPLVDGSATFEVSPPHGTTSVRAAYAGNSNYEPSTSSTQSYVVDKLFALSATADSNSTYSVQVTKLTPSFTGTVQLACSGLPRGAECVFSDDSVEPDAEVALVVRTAPRTQAIMPLGLLVVAAALLLRKRWRLIALLALGACGESSVDLDGIPPGSYPFQLTATSGDESHAVGLIMIVE